MWERSAQSAAASSRFQPHAFQGSDTVPPSVSTVEVRIVRGSLVEVRRFVDPTQTREVVIDGLKTGAISVQVFGYDVAFARARSPRDRSICRPSYKSTAVNVTISAGQTTDAGVVDLLGQPFVTDFDPPLGATGVSRSASLSFLVVSPINDIAPASLNITVNGSPAVINGVEQPGAALIACADLGEPACADLNRQLTGFQFFFDSPESIRPIRRSPSSSAPATSASRCARSRASSISSPPERWSPRRQPPKCRRRPIRATPSFTPTQTAVADAHVHVDADAGTNGYADRDADGDPGRH